MSNTHQRLFRNISDVITMDGAQSEFEGYQMISKILVCGMASLLLSSCVNIAGSEQPVATTEVRRISSPSSLPPEGYLSNKWVDSRGCNYLSSNSGAWVPQVTQKGSHLCTGTVLSQNVATPTTSASTVPVNAPIAQTLEQTAKPVVQALQTAPSQQIIVPVAEALVPVEVETTGRKPAVEGIKITVPVQVIEPEGDSRAIVQIGTFTEQSYVDRIIGDLKKSGYDVKVKIGSDNTYTVVVYAKDNQSTGELLYQMHGLGFKGAKIA